MRQIGGVLIRRIASVGLSCKRGGIAALGLLLIIYMGSSATASALQVLQASDHAELAAEVSDTEVNRIALDGDRIARVIQSPGGFTVEHDPVRGDLYLYPDAAADALHAADGLRSAEALRSADPLRGADSFSASDGWPAPAPVTLYVGTERGFTYRLTLSTASRGSTQILIRNPAVAESHDAGPVADGFRAELVSLILAVARREPVSGYVAVPAAQFTESPERGSPVELWRGPRFTARVLNAPAGSGADAEQLAKLSGRRVLAAWLSPPGGGPNGERIAVLVENNDGWESVR